MRVFFGFISALLGFLATVILLGLIFNLGVGIIFGIWAFAFIYSLVAGSDYQIRELDRRHEEWLENRRRRGLWTPGG